MRILFIVHYFPPLNSAGARRVLALSKHLTSFGHHVTILTTTKHPYDGALTEAVPAYCEVIEIGGRSRIPPSPDPRPPRAVGRSALVQALVMARRRLTRLFGQLIDHRVFFAARFALNALPRSAKEALSRADVVVSSCPPWPVHLAASLASRRYKKPWLADYRDQFSGNHIFPGNFISARLERAVDRRLLRSAAAVCVVSDPMREYYEALHTDVTTIANGYDDDALAAAANGPAEPKDPSLRVVRHLGTITADRLPKALLASLRHVDSEIRAKLLFEFYGDSRLLRSLVESDYPDLARLMRFLPEVPYRRSLALMLSADALLFSETSAASSLSAKGVLTTKLFEYMAASRPVLAEIEPTTLAGKLLAESGLAAVCSTDPREIGSALERLAVGDVAVAPNLAVISRYSRLRLSREFEGLLARCAGSA